MFYLTTHLTHCTYGYMASHIWTIQIERKETRCRHIGYSFRLAARVLLHASSHRQDNIYDGLCYTSRGALAGTKEINGFAMKDRSDDPSHREQTLLPRSYISLPNMGMCFKWIQSGSGDCARNATLTCLIPSRFRFSTSIP